MAAFYVLVGIRDAGMGGIPGGKLSYTKAEAEALTADKRFSAGTIKVMGPIQEAKIIEIDCASKAEAMRFARVVLGQQPTGVVLVAASPLTAAEAGAKAGKTVDAANIVQESAE